MDMQQRNRLRTLAATYAGYACGAVMQQRREKWLRHNGMRERTFPFHIEDNGSYLRDLTPPLQCADPAGRQLEGRLLHAIISYEQINDDRIIPSRFVVGWNVKVGPVCEELQYTRADDGHGGTLGFETNKPIRDIDADFGKLKKRTPVLDRAGTEQQAELATDAFQGLLPVAVGNVGSFHSDGVANKAVLLMGMEELYLQMALNPEAVQRFFTFFAEDNMALGQWEEDQGLLILNHDGNHGYCSGSSLYSDEIPGREILPGERIRTTDRYGYLEAQEAVGLSPDMFAEFLMPHFRKMAARFRLFKFGCCEPVHHIMPLLKELPGLRKVSVTPWCDQRKLAAYGMTDIIWSRKPEPLKLCGEAFDPGELRTHLRETLEIGAGYFIEFVFRDTCRLTGGMQDRVAETCRVVRDLTGHPAGAR